MKQIIKDRLAQEGIDVDTLGDVTRCMQLTDEELLCRAIIENEIDALHILMDNCSNVNTVNRMNETPLSLAARIGNVEAIEYLMTAGARIEVDGVSALSSAIESDNKEIIEYLIDTKADINYMDSQGHSPLHIAALNSADNKIVKSLLKAGGDPNLHNGSGVTPLVCAIESDNESVRMLIEMGGAKLNKMDEMGNTALHVIAERGTNNIANIVSLIAAGAKVNIENAYGQTPLSISMDKQIEWENKNPSVDAAKSPYYGVYKVLINATKRSIEMNERLCKDKSISKDQDVKRAMGDDLEM